MGLDALDYIIRLEEEFDVQIKDEDIDVDRLTVGAWEEYIAERRPDLDPADIVCRHRLVLGEFLCLKNVEIAKIKTTDRLVEDLNFE